uniref:Uncharacterized protein n=1 Tax=Neobodo designis TaxID=312471 RepID=A0A7S1PKC2_NEODS|mmetsp:Transcript_10182/g.31417  ORF Transcript_10182/g.31417 Transcript_10182/m.31417 type:complete len:194 (+) Transcript_10182:130-711(+)
MLRSTALSHMRKGPAPITNRRNMGLGKGVSWRGNYGAFGRWAGRVGMVEEVSAKKSITQVDNEIMDYVHKTRIRHDQMMTTYHGMKRSRQIAIWNARAAQRRWHTKMYRAYQTFVQYETMKTLKEQAGLVTQYGQAAVNRAIGDYKTLDERKQRATLVKRLVSAPTVIKSPTPHVLTQRQAVAHRFDRKWRMY